MAAYEMYTDSHHHSHHLPGRKLFFLKFLPIIAIGVLVVTLVLIFFVGMMTAEVPPSLDSCGSLSSTSQAYFLSYYRKAQQQAAIDKLSHRRASHEGDIVVTGSGDDQLDQYLTVFNAIAYHFEEIEAEILAADPTAKPLSLPTDVDLEVYAAAIIGTSLYESSDVDTPEIGGGANVLSEWRSLTEEQKIAALLDDNYMVSRWSTDYPYYNNALTGKWGYGLYQWTADRRKGLAYVWRDCGYDMSTVYGQSIFIVAEGMNAFGTTMHRYQQAVINECTAYNFPNGIDTADCTRAVALFYYDCVRGTRAADLATANANLPTRNSGLVGGDVHGSPRLYNGHTVLECLQTFATEGIDGVARLVGGS